MLWGACASILCSSTTLCYSVTEYCCPVWARSSYISVIDTQLHSSMCLISGCLHSTPVSWLRVLSNAAKQQATRCFRSLKPIQTGLCMLMCWNIHLLPRLASRRPIWSDMTPVDIITQWREDWQLAFTSVVNYTIVTDPSIWQPGFDLPRQSWSLLNCFQTGQGLCHAILDKWGLAKSRTCDCGQQRTEPYCGRLSIDKVRWRTATTSRS